ncbi:efflux RND transporter periplasmic adaptor subunit [Desulfocastanea catecholica]
MKIPKRMLLTIVPILAAVLITILLLANRPALVRKEVEEAVRTLRVIKAPVVDFVPRAVGYGVAAPALVWEAVAEVEGTLVFVDDRLKSGELITAGSTLAEIDPAEYRLAVARLEANIEETRAKLNELGEDESNITKLLTIELRSLKLSEKLLDRKNTALEKNAISQDDVDREERNFLLQKKQVQQLRNDLALIPAKRKALNSTLDVLRYDLEQAATDLKKTKIQAPYDCRLGEVGLSAGQFVKAGQLLFQAQGTAVTEVEALLGAEELRHLLGKEKDVHLLSGMTTGTFETLFSDVKVFVSLQSGDWSVRWQGSMERLRETMDSKTREMKVVVSVADPYKKAIPGVRPPLVAGMFCRIEFQAPVRPGTVVVPRSALHDGEVFVVDDQSRLAGKGVVVDYLQDEVAVIRSGLSGDETIVVSDPSPAIRGMKVEAVGDDSLLQHLLSSSQGMRDEG